VGQNGVHGGSVQRVSHQDVIIRRLDQQCGQHWLQIQRPRQRLRLDMFAEVVGFDVAAIAA
jgi:uncharacterized coiled-coil protein SlyX